MEVLRAATALQQAPGPLDKHRLLMALKETNAEVFYALLQVSHGGMQKGWWHGMGWVGMGWDGMDKTPAQGLARRQEAAAC